MTRFELIKTICVFNVRISRDILEKLNYYLKYNYTSLKDEFKLYSVKDKENVVGNIYIYDRRKHYKSYKIIIANKFQTKTYKSIDISEEFSMEDILNVALIYAMQEL